MAFNRKTTEPEDIYKSRFQKFGLYLVLIFYVSSIIYITFLGKNRGALDPNVKTITIAHWQLEDGFREGFEEMIKRFEKIKAEQGEKVKVIQTTIPWNGYEQWFMTQLIGENPVDVVELLGNSHMYNQYFHPLSPYLGKENPFNKGTVLEGLPWKDTYIDHMVAAVDPIYAEYFGIGTCFSVYRLFVNLDLLEKATGSRKMPEDISEWLACCQKLKEYGEKIGKPIIPIGVRGFDRETLEFLFNYYYYQTIGNLIDNNSRFCDGNVLPEDILEGMKDKTIDKDRILAVVEVVREIGQYLSKGFPSCDLEQTKFLFCSGLVGFFPEGTWNAYSLVRNSPFEVGIIPVPVIGYKHRLSKYFTGRVTESGARVLGLMGIPKTTKHFDLALELLQFMSSYEINQMTMNSCKWAPGVKEAKFEGILKYFKPVTGDAFIDYNNIFPFYYEWHSNSHMKLLQALENTIIENPKNPEDYFMKELKGSKSVLIIDLEEGITAFYRSNMDGEMQRSQISIGLLRKNISDKQAERLRLRSAFANESYAERTTKQLVTDSFLKEVKDAGN